ncbi:hypothetical protein [Rossellomorea sp. NS-SX7]|uniref:hypothetical protein n=1 Tax=Rossellomorea sp. NS-SX7 TaxID=3463856 RepID=UPI004058476E
MINIKVLFWNIKNNLKIVPTISQSCREHKINIVILSEANRIDPEIIEKSLRKVDLNFAVELPMPNNRTVLFHNLGKRINKYHDGTFYSLFKIKFKNSLILLVTLHLPSMLHNTENEIGAQAAQIKREIEKYEEELKTNKTIVVGDFNLNPFSELMVSAYGFNAIMDKETALKIDRTIYGVKYNYFYNPMWTLHGNINNNVLGTYFYHSKPTSYIWNMFDQVLIRPQLIEQFNFNELEIISEIGDKPLLKDSGRPHSTLYSDHLPLKFSIL